MNRGFKTFSTPRHRVFESGEITFAAGDTVTLAHGFGQAPSNFWCILRCVTAENNYNVGDDIQASEWHVANGTNANLPRVFTIKANNTDLIVDIYGTAANIRHSDFASHASVTPTVSRWRLIVRAELNFPAP